MKSETRKNVPPVGADDSRGEGTRRPLPRYTPIVSTKAFDNCLLIAESTASLTGLI